MPAPHPTPPQPPRRSPIKVLLHDRCPHLRAARQEVPGHGFTTRRGARTLYSVHLGLDLHLIQRLSTAGEAQSGVRSAKVPYDVQTAMSNPRGGTMADLLEALLHLRDPFVQKVEPPLVVLLRHGPFPPPEKPTRPTGPLHRARPRGLRLNNRRSTYLTALSQSHIIKCAVLDSDKCLASLLTLGTQSLGSWPVTVRSAMAFSRRATVSSRALVSFSSPDASNGTTALWTFYSGGGR
jgi:hypothetical protein